MMRGALLFLAGAKPPAMTMHDGARAGAGAGVLDAQPISVDAVSGSGDSGPLDSLRGPSAGAECRICLLNQPADDLVAPCACTGSVRYAHMACLKVRHGNAPRAPARPRCLLSREALRGQLWYRGQG